jgi:hypothetical protein
VTAFSDNSACCQLIRCAAADIGKAVHAAVSLVASTWTDCWPVVLELALWIDATWKYWGQVEQSLGDLAEWTLVSRC